MSAAPPMLPSTQQLSSTSLSPRIVIMTLLVLSVALCLIFCSYHRLCNNNRHTFNPPAGHATTTVQFLITPTPLFTFSSVTRCSNASAVVEADCAVCLSRFVPRDTLRLLPLCCHAFHSRCIDTWLSSGHKTCPLCHSDVNASAASNLLPRTWSCNGSFRPEIVSVGRCRNHSTSNIRRSYSIGSFDYVMEFDKRSSSSTCRTASTTIRSTLATTTPTTAGAGLGECMDRLSSRTASFRSSQRFFTSSSSRSEVSDVGVWVV